MDATVGVSEEGHRDLAGGIVEGSERQRKSLCATACEIILNRFWLSFCLKGGGRYFKASEITEEKPLARGTCEGDD